MAENSSSNTASVAIVVLVVVAIAVMLYLFVFRTGGEPALPDAPDVELNVGTEGE